MEKYGAKVVQNYRNSALGTTLLDSLKTLVKKKKLKQEFVELVMKDFDRVN